MDAIPAALTIKALDGLVARSVVTAQNIANAGTPGYRPLRVSFENELAAAATRGPEAIRSVEPTIRPETGDPTLRMDLELATASSTAMRYAALVEVLNRQLQIDAVAVSGGR